MTRSLHVAHCFLHRKASRAGIPISRPKRGVRVGTAAERNAPRAKPHPREQFVTSNPVEQNSVNASRDAITVTIPNKLGLHLRPASQLVKLASKFEDCEIQISKDGEKVNAKSIMGVIMLAAEQGSELILEAVGASRTVALAELAEMISSGFGEE